MLTALKHDTYYLNYILARICVRALPLADVCRMYGLVRYRPTSIQPNHGHTYVLLARTIYIRCIYGIFGRKITKYTVIYGVYVRFWPTLYIWLWPIPKVNTFIWLWSIPKVNSFMAMANTQGQYIHGYGQYPRSIHSYGYGQYLRPIKYGYGQYMAITWSNQNGVQFLLTLIPARPFSHTRLLMPELCIAKRATHNHHHIFALKWTLNNSVQPGVHLFCPPLSSFYPSLRLC